MTCTEIIRELKCKFPPCPCQKCLKERVDSVKENVQRELHQCDTPPERPVPKYQFQCKCLCKPETTYKRKCPPRPPPSRQLSAQTSCGGCRATDDCFTGNGCCNTGRNFITFMMNIIGLIAFLIIANIVFWLFLLKCTVILGIKVYHSKRTTQVAVVSVISLLFLLIFCTAATTSFQRYLARRSSCKFADSSKCKSQPTSASTPYTKPKSPTTSSWLAFKWSKSKEIVPTVQAKTRFPWTLRKETSVSKTQTSSSLIPFTKWSQTTTVVEKPLRKSWFTTNIWRRTTTTTKSDYTPKKTETRSSWLPSFGWRQARTTTTITKEVPKASSSWLPSFGWRQATTTTAATTNEVPKARSSWLPSFGWRQARTTTAATTKEVPKARSSWLPSLGWRQARTTTTITKKVPKASSSWLPSFGWRQATTTTAATTKEVPKARSSWLPSFGWRQATTTTTTITTIKEASKPSSSWLPSFKWRQTTTTTTTTKEKSKKAEKRRPSWIPSFIWQQSSTTTKEIAYIRKPRPSWLPSFGWSRTSTKETQQPPTVARTSWVPSFGWRQSTRKESETATTQTVERSLWRPSLKFPTTLVTYFRRTTTKEVEAPKKDTKMSSTWLPAIWWSKTTTTTTTTKEIGPSQKKPEARSSWLPNFNWRQTTTTTTTTKKTVKKPQKQAKTSSSSWLPSFLWSSSAKKTQSVLSACGIKQQKVTVTITDDEARQIYKKSKLYAIPTEMKQPPNLIIHLRDWIQRNTD